jgi:transcriptional regulator with XRE-family HTH domain
MRYATLARLVEEQISRLKDQPGPKRKRRPASLRALARRIGVSPAALNAWTLGNSFPREEHIPRLVKCFYPDGGVEAGEFERKVREARGRDEILDVDDLRSGRQLKVSYLSYAPFCGVPDANGNPQFFLDKFFNRLIELSHLEQQAFPNDPLKDAPDLLRSGQRDVRLCMLDTPSLTLDIYALHSPCRVSLNAVCMRQGLTQGRIQEIQEVLTRPRHDLQKTVLPITLPAEVSSLYLRDTLGFKDDRVTIVEQYKTPQYVSRFLEVVRGAEQGITPVFLADELTALRVLRDICAANKRATLVFPIATEKSSQDLPKRQLPAFLLSLASVSERQKHLKKYLQKALRLILLTEIEIAAGLYKELYDELVKTVDDCLKLLDDDDLRFLKETQREPVVNDSVWRQACAIQFARFTLRLSAEEELAVLEEPSLPWRHILHRVRERIGPLPQGTEPLSEGKFKLAYRVTDPVCTVPKRGPYLRDPKRKPDDIDLSDFGFLGKLLKPFQHLVDPLEIRLLDDPYDWARKLPSSFTQDDIRIGLYETLDLTLNWDFFRTPYSPWLNAVVLRDDIKRITNPLKDLRNILTGNEDDDNIITSQSVAPVVLFGGAAYEYLLHNQPFREQQIQFVPSLNPAVYAQKLLATRGETGKRIGIAVVGVMTCLRVLEELKGKGKLVFPLLGSPHLPSFNVGVAINRQSEQWARYLPNVLSVALRENTERIAAQLHDLYLAIVEEVLIALTSVDDVLDVLNLSDVPDIHEGGDPTVWTKEKSERTARKMAENLLCLDKLHLDKLHAEEALNSLLIGKWYPVLLNLHNRVQAQMRLV